VYGVAVAQVRHLSLHSSLISTNPPSLTEQKLLAQNKFFIPLKSRNLTVLFEWSDFLLSESEFSDVVQEVRIFPTPTRRAGDNPVAKTTLSN